MRILFILDSVENPTSANVLMAQRLAGVLCAAGHTVHLLELWDGLHPQPELPGCTVHCLAFADERLMNAALENGRSGGSPIPVRLARLCCHPTAVAAAFRQLVLHAPRRVVDTRRELEKLDAAFHFEVICAVCAPYRAAFALETAQVQAKKAIWQLDPYASNRDYQAPGGYPRELELLNHLAAAFITRQAVGDYAPGAPLAAAAEKVHVLDFPSLVPPVAVPTHAADSKKRCVFCGSLYPGLREPGFALELFRALGPASGWILTMAGGGWQYFAADAAQTKAVLGEQFEQPGPVPAETARTMQAQADVLLNLGNAVDNQLPSKLFDYFAAGKPVLHLCVIENDPALPYLARYPLALVLHQGQADAADILHRWLGEVCGKQLPFGEVCDLFPELVPQAVAAEFVRCCRGCLRFAGKRDRRGLAFRRAGRHDRRTGRPGHYRCQRGCPRGNFNRLQQKRRKFCTGSHRKCGKLFCPAQKDCPGSCPYLGHRVRCRPHHTAGGPGGGDTGAGGHPGRDG